MKVVGLDLSLTSTGYAAPDRLATYRFKPSAKHTPKQDSAVALRLPRLRWLTTQILDQLVIDMPTHVVVEGPSHGSIGGHEHERGGFWWRIIEACDDAGIEILIATPTMLKKFATGKGNADKDIVLGATYSRFPWFKGGNDEADALWAAAMGYELLGHSVVALPQPHLDALKTWR